MRLEFRLRYRGSLVKVTVNSQEAVYELVEGPELVIFHHGEEHLLRDTLTRPIPKKVPTLPRPDQPPGRSPLGHLQQVPERYRTQSR